MLLGCDFVWHVPRHTVLAVTESYTIGRCLVLAECADRYEMHDEVGFTGTLIAKYDTFHQNENKSRMVPTKVILRGTPLSTIEKAVE